MAMSVLSIDPGMMDTPCEVREINYERTERGARRRSGETTIIDRLAWVKGGYAQEIMEAGSQISVMAYRIVMRKEEGEKIKSVDEIYLPITEQTMQIFGVSDVENKGIYWLIHAYERQ